MSMVSFALYFHHTGSRRIPAGHLAIAQTPRLIAHLGRTRLSSSADFEGRAGPRPDPATSAWRLRTVAKWEEFNEHGRSQLSHPHRREPVHSAEPGRQRQLHDQRQLLAHPVLAGRTGPRALS